MKLRMKLACQEVSCTMHSCRSSRRSVTGEKFNKLLFKEIVPFLEANENLLPQDAISLAKDSTVPVMPQDES